MFVAPSRLPVPGFCASTTVSDGDSAEIGDGEREWRRRQRSACAVGRFAAPARRFGKQLVHELPAGDPLPHRRGSQTVEGAGERHESSDPIPFLRLVPADRRAAMVQPTEHRVHQRAAEGMGNDIDDIDAEIAADGLEVVPDVVDVVGVRGEQADGAGPR